MAQRLQARLDGGDQIGREIACGDKNWLSLLVETFEIASRHPLKPCNPIDMSILKARLARPAASMTDRTISMH